jgi:DNA-directed RNA polymerase subunit D
METVINTKDKFVARGEISESLANAIRRSVTEISTLAISEVEFYKNDSALYDEIVAHRIGLVPLKTEKSMNSKTKVTLKLVKEGPATVYSGDLKGDGDVVFEKMPITLIGEGHKIELVATATLGKGSEHAKHIPGLTYYRHVLEVKSAPEIDKIISKNKGLIKAEKKGSKWICDLNESEVVAIESIDKTAVSDTPELLFIVESYGNMPAKDIFTKAIEALQDNIAEFEKSVK